MATKKPKNAVNLYHFIAKEIVIILSYLPILLMPAFNKRLWSTNYRPGLGDPIKCSLCPQETYTLEEDDNDDDDVM